MANDELITQIDELYHSIRQKNRCIPSSRCSIIKVPKKLRRVKKGAYIPEIISIGPLHHDKSSLISMEQHKEWYLNALLSRISSTPDSTEVKLRELIKTMKKLEPKARECYAEPINLTSDQFAEMMLLDSCFILELFIRKHESGKLKRFKNDPIFNTVWMMDSLQRDLILLENQLPFFVLKDIFESIKDLEQGGLSLTQLAANFFDTVISSFGVATQTDSCDFAEYNHFLHLLHSILVPEAKSKDYNESSSDRAASKNQNSTTRCQNLLQLPCSSLCGKSSSRKKHRTWQYIHCAMELYEAGVNFREKTEAKSLLDITFDKNGVLEIPQIKLADYTDTVIRNLLALEQCNADYGSGITSYAALLDSLISTQRDVRLLRRREIIDCGLDDHEEAALAFNKLGDRVKVKDFYYDEICGRVNVYYRADWHRWRSILKREYFRNPWASISIIVAIVITILTLTQTVISVMSYNPK